MAIGGFTNQFFGSYRLQRCCQRALLQVYLAQHPADRPRAVKVMRPELKNDKVARRAFENEHQALLACGHVNLYSYDQIDGLPAFLMSFRSARLCAN